jgi:hypothetical protein
MIARSIVVTPITALVTPLAWATHVGRDHLEHPERWETGSFGIRRARHDAQMRPIDQIQMRPIDEIGTLMTWEEFSEDVDGGMLIDYDGFGELATGDRVSTIKVRPEWATHVLWYNR